jgi:hypothetical protein
MKKIVFAFEIFILLAALPVYTYAELTHDEKQHGALTTKDITDEKTDLGLVPCGVHCL